MNEHFSFMYADLCRKITDNWSTGTENEEEESLGKSFRVKLLERYVLGVTGESCRLLAFLEN
jgi:hypothetical protein